MKAIATRLFAFIAALATITSAVAPAHAGSLSDAEIIGVYSQVNSFDIETALLGEIKGHSDQVRALGRMVSADHTGVRKAIHDMAIEIGVQPLLPSSRIAAARGHDTVVMQLHALSGVEFDIAYLRHEIAFHRAAIDAVKTLLQPAASNPKLKAHFQAILPAFEHHLAETIRVAKELKVTTDQ